jgi:hypothetical protein
MTGSLSRRRDRTAVWLLALLAATGCSGPSPQRYIPAEADARQALETVLRAWQAGQAPGPIETATPPVIAVDTMRRPGQGLDAYVIVGEAGGDGPRCFVVRLHLDSPEEEVKVRYVVFGISPLWVYRQEDFDRLIHWECKMSTERTRETDPAAPN